MDVNEICAQLNELKRGGAVVYHDGFLARDRGPDEVSRKSPPQRDITLIAQTAWGLSQAGKVGLIQKRLGDKRWEYIAMGVK